jgi:hypothetical protein
MPVALHERAGAAALANLGMVRRVVAAMAGIAARMIAVVGALMMQLSVVCPVTCVRLASRMCAVRVMAVPDMTVVPMAARMLRMSRMTTVMAVGTMDGVHGMTARRSMRVGAWVRRITGMRMGTVAMQRAVRHRNEQENTGKPRATREDVQ